MTARQACLRYGAELEVTVEAGLDKVDESPICRTSGMVLSVLLAILACFSQFSKAHIAAPSVPSDLVPLHTGARRHRGT